jgi:hypothetical protein
MNPWTPIDLLVSTLMTLVAYRGALVQLRKACGTVRSLRAVQLLDAIAFASLAVAAFTFSVPLSIAGSLLLVLGTFFVGTVIQFTGGPDPTCPLRHEIQAIMALLHPTPLDDARRAELEARRSAMAGLRSPLTGRTIDAMESVLVEELRPDRDSVRLQQAIDELQAGLRAMRASYPW